MHAKVTHYTARTRPEYKQLNVRLPVSAYQELGDVADAMRRSRGGEWVTLVDAVVHCIKIANNPTIIKYGS